MKERENAENVTQSDLVDEDNRYIVDQQSTEESDTMDQDLQDMLNLAETAKLRPTKPYVSTDDQYRFYRVDLVPESQLPGSNQKKIDISSDAFKNVAKDGQPSNNTPFTPRTAIASRRLMSAFEFDRSAVKRRFHAEYPENAPDLRKNTSQGKRHLIHGYHAYYYHWDNKTEYTYTYIFI